MVEHTLDVTDRLIELAFIEVSLRQAAVKI